MMVITYLFGVVFDMWITAEIDVALLGVRRCEAFENRPRGEFRPSMVAAMLATD